MLVFANLGKNLRGNLNFQILITEDRRKFKFVEGIRQICQIFLKENRAKFFSTSLSFQGDRQALAETYFGHSESAW